MPAGRDAPATGPTEDLLAGSSVSTDRELWQQAASGDHDAFAELFERHVEAVWNQAYRLTGSWSRAEDLASATFLTAWRKRAEVLLVRDSALPWLYTVAANLARSEFRSANRFLRAVSRLPVVESVDDHADRVAGRIDDDRRLREVLDAIRRLPRSEREAIELCLLGELSTADAAELLGIAEVSIRSRISRGRSRLRTLLEDQSS
jgi:RNA polymerase sigma-70 factor, ECF subfamily